jgi:hypothetical protein
MAVLLKLGDRVELIHHYEGVDARTKGNVTAYMAALQMFAVKFDDGQWVTFEMYESEFSKLFNKVTG